MIGAGTFISPLIKVITTVAILAAVYFFMVKPILSSSERISNNAFESIDEIQGINDDVLDDIGPQIEGSLRQSQKIVEKQTQSSSVQLKDANKLLDCIADASGDVNRITTCHNKFSP